MRMLHANVVCSDFDTSFDFYTRVLGGTALEVTDDDGADLSRPMGFEGGSQYRAALIYWNRQGRGPYIDLLEWKDKGHPVERSAKDLGVARLCWQVDDLDEAMDDLQSKGVRFNAPPNEAHVGRWRVRAVFFPDPDGVLLEVVETTLVEQA